MSVQGFIIQQADWVLIQCPIRLPKLEFNYELKYKETC